MCAALTTACSWKSHKRVSRGSARAYGCTHEGNAHVDYSPGTLALSASSSAASLQGVARVASRNRPSPGAGCVLLRSTSVLPRCTFYDSLPFAQRAVRVCVLRPERLPGADSATTIAQRTFCVDSRWWVLKKYIECTSRRRRLRTRPRPGNVILR